MTPVPSAFQTLNIVFLLQNPYHSRYGRGSDAEGESDFRYGNLLGIRILLCMAVNFLQNGEFTFRYIVKERIEAQAGDPVKNLHILSLNIVVFHHYAPVFLFRQTGKIFYFVIK